MQCELILDDNYFRIKYEIEDKSFNHEFGNEIRKELNLVKVELLVPYVKDEWIDLTSNLTEIAVARISNKISQDRS